MKSRSQNLGLMKEILNRFVAELSLSKSQLTLEAYKYDVSNFISFLNDNKIKRVTSIKSSHIITYLGSCKQAGKSDASITRYYMSIKSFFKFLRRYNMISIDLTEDIIPLKNDIKAFNVPDAAKIYKI